MSYSYSDHRHYVFTDDGQRQFLRIRDRSQELLKEAGAFRLDAVIRRETGDSWHMLACVDRLVELGEVYAVREDCATQHRIYVKGAF